MGPSTTMYTPSKASAEDLSLPASALARYHSAPSSTLATLLEQDLYRPADAAELVQYLAHTDLGDYASYGDAGLSMKLNQEQARRIKKENAHTQPSYLNQSDRGARHCGRMGGSFPEHIGQVPLSAILEHSVEETLVSQPGEDSPQESSLLKPSLASSAHLKSNLIRHSSLPTDFESRLAMEDMSENQTGTRHVGAHVPTTSPRSDDSTGGKVYVLTSNLSPTGVPVRKCFADAVDSCKADDYSILREDLNQCSLVRQSSSPAGLLSQLTLDDFSSGGADKVAMSSAHGLVQGWDEAAMDSAMQKLVALGQRKRGREADARLFKGLPTADVYLMGSLEHGSFSSANHYSAASNGDIAPADSVLCRSRAKRGCATHPRSIAERVRRMKISERMKKLQDLVPNLDKQAHTADMLDEVVEYVKLLQRQVQELSKHNTECNGMCRKKGGKFNEM